MGCGCSKNRKNQIANRKKRQKTSLKANQQRSKVVASMSKDQFSTAINSRLVICNVCSHSIKARDRRGKKIKMCGKVRLHLHTIATDPLFKCPIKKFTVVS